MPKSRVRKKRTYTPPPAPSPRKRRSAPWVFPTMMACFGIGLVWLFLYYVSGGDIPGMRALGGWNLLIGFAFLIGGFGLSTRWF